MVFALMPQPPLSRPAKIHPEPPFRTRPYPAARTAIELSQKRTLVGRWAGKRSSARLGSHGMTFAAMRTTICNWIAAR